MFVSSQNVLIEDSFIRSDDDSIAIKGMDPTMNTEGVVVRNCVLYNQRYGNCMEIGFELFNQHVRNISFENIVCLHQVHGPPRIANTLCWHTYGVATTSALRPPSPSARG